MFPHYNLLVYCKICENFCCLQIFIFLLRPIINPHYWIFKDQQPALVQKIVRHSCNSNISKRDSPKKEWNEMCSRKLRNIYLTRSKRQKKVYPIGLLHPLPILEKKLKIICIEVIIRLHKINGKVFMFIVVDRLIKCAHFFPYTLISRLPNCWFILQKGFRITWFTEEHC